MEQDKHCSVAIQTILPFSDTSCLLSDLSISYFDKTSNASLSGDYIGFHHQSEHPLISFCGKGLNKTRICKLILVVICIDYNFNVILYAPSNL